MLLKQSSNVKKAVKKLGIENVLVESDCPFARIDEEEFGP